MAPKIEALVGHLLPVAPILVPVGVHFVLVCFVFLSNWLPFTYFFSHVILIGVGFWACHAKTDILPAIVFMCVVLVSILMDIVQLGLRFSDGDDNTGNGTAHRTWQFSAGMCIMNLLFKPISIVLSCIAVYVRAGGNIGGLRGGSGAGDAGGAGGSNEDYSNLHGSNDQGPN